MLQWKPVILSFTPVLQASSHIRAVNDVIKHYHIYNSLSILTCVCVVYYMCLGAITSNTIVLAGPSNFYDPSKYGFALHGFSKGGAPTSFTWRRYGVALTSSTPYTIAAPVLTNSENSCSERLYRSRVTVTGKVTGVFTYTVTNANPSFNVVGTLNIEGMYYCSVLV